MKFLSGRHIAAQDYQFHTCLRTLKAQHSNNFHRWQFHSKCPIEIRIRSSQNEQWTRIDKKMFEPKSRIFCLSLRTEY